MMHMLSRGGVRMPSQFHARERESVLDPLSQLAQTIRPSLSVPPITGGYTEQQQLPNALESFGPCHVTGSCGGLIIVSKCGEGSSQWKEMETHFHVYMTVKRADIMVEHLSARLIFTPSSARLYTWNFSARGRTLSQSKEDRGTSRRGENTNKKGPCFQVSFSPSCPGGHEPVKSDLVMVLFGARERMLTSKCPALRTWRCLDTLQPSARCFPEHTCLTINTEIALSMFPPGHAPHNMPCS
jgi:hypothetical protein